LHHIHGNNIPSDLISHIDINSKNTKHFLTFYNICTSDSRFRTYIHRFSCGDDYHFAICN